MNTGKKLTTNHKVMTDKAGHNDNKKSDYNKVAEQFPDGQQDHVKELWELSAHAKSVRQDVSGEEVENALSEVHKRMESAGSETVAENSRATRFHDWRWIIAAAVFLMAFGIGILFVPQSVHAPYGEMTSLTLPDGSEVELNSGSEVRYNRLFSLSNREIELNGEAFFSVQNGEIPFEVNANGTTVRVTGTRFNVRSWSEGPGEETEVTVTEGSVQFFPEGEAGRSVTIMPGQLSRWAAEMDVPTNPDSVSLDRILGWRDHKIAFNKKPLPVLLRELERRFDTSIKLEAERMRTESITVYYVDPKDVEAILKDVCRVKGLRYAETANGYRIYQ